MRYFDPKDKNAACNLGIHLKHLINHNRRSSQPLVFLCIGTDRATGDCLGPLIGYKLEAYSPVPVHVLGSLDQPAHAKNLTDVLSYIEQELPSAFVIAIDACLGVPAHVGYITLSDSGLKPGEGVKKALPQVGDIAITGIVNHTQYRNSMMMLASTRLSVVMSLADIIYQGILYALTD